MKKNSSLKKLQKIKLSIWALIFVCLVISSQSCKTTKKLTGAYPIKTAAYWTCPVMSKSQADSLSLHDIVIASIENQFNNRPVLKYLKKLNPNLKLLGYYNSPEIWAKGYQSTPWQNKIIGEIKSNRESWLLKSDQGEQVVFWQGMWLLNMSDSCPKINGQIYAEWIASKLNQEIFSDSIWDGHFLDNGGGNIYWVNDWLNNPAQGGIDANRDKQADDQPELDNAWLKGLEKYYLAIRQAQGPDFILIANKGSLDFKDVVDGKFFENFPNDYLGSKKDGGWQQCINNAKKLGPYTIFHVSEANLKFGLASALLLNNVYIAIGQDDPGLFRQFTISPGSPKGKIETSTIKQDDELETQYSRRFKNGRVAVRPSRRLGELDYD